MWRLFGRKKRCWRLSNLKSFGQIFLSTWKCFPVKRFIQFCWNLKNKSRIVLLRFNFKIHQKWPWLHTISNKIENTKFNVFEKVTYVFYNCNFFIEFVFVSSWNFWWLKLGVTDLMKPHLKKIMKSSTPIF